MIGTVIFLLGFPILEGYRDYLIFPVDPKVSKEWHQLGFIIRALVGILLLMKHAQFIPLYGFYFWSAFDLVTGVGTTSWFDRKLGEYSPYIKVIGLILSTVLVYKF